VFTLLAVLWLLGTAISATDSTEYEAYVVQQGQTLADIATLYGMPIETLAQFNRLKSTDPITTGQILMVPIVTQLAPQMTTLAPEAKAITPQGNQVNGVLGVVTALRVEIWNKPAGGQMLFDNATRGTELLVVGQAEKHYSVLMSDGSTGWVLKAAVSLTDRQMVVDRPALPTVEPETNPAGGRQDIIDTAYEYLGIPYKYGGRLPESVDCSLLVQTVFARHGIKLPRTAAEQYKVGAPVDVTDLQAGDRLYFYKRDTDVIGHTGLYIGNGRFIHASSNRKAVATDDLTSNTYWSIFAGARR
jgi:cell wall-associated NlpC family hydrolase